MIFISLIWTVTKKIFVSSCTWNCAQKPFYGNFLCLKVFELNLTICRYNSLPWSGSNQKWSKHGFHRYIDFYVSERHGGAIWEELEQNLCRKVNFDSKWRMTVYGWLKVKLLYYISTISFPMLFKVWQYVF